MTIIIANCTKQTLHYCYRLPESNQMARLVIHSGTQEQFGEEWSPSQTERVIKHMEAFGMRRVEQINTKLKNFSGLLYSTNKPVAIDKIQVAHEQVVEDQTDRSIRQASLSALAFDASNAQIAKGKRPKVSQVEVEEMDMPREEKRKGKKVKFDVAVAEDGTNDPKALNL